MTTRKTYVLTIDENFVKESTSCRLLIRTAMKELFPGQTARIYNQITNSPLDWVEIDRNPSRFRVSKWGEVKRKGKRIGNERLLRKAGK